MQSALQDYLKQRSSDSDNASIEDFEDQYDEAFNGGGGRRVRTDDAAKALADTPMLTGDPEFDKWELEETRADREPINARAPHHNS